MPALGAVSETGGSSGGDCMRRSPRSRRPQCPVKDARIQERMRDGRWACSHEFELEKADAGGVGRHLERRAHETRPLEMRSTPKGVARLLSVCTGPNELELTN